MILQNPTPDRLVARYWPGRGGESEDVWRLPKNEAQSCSSTTTSVGVPQASLGETARRFWWTFPRQDVFLILIDAYSKWLKVKPLSAATSTTAIEHLHSIFVTHGLPEGYVTLNCLHIILPVMVWLKEQSKASRRAWRSSWTLSRWRQESPGIYFGITWHLPLPAELLLGRIPCSQLDLLNPKLSAKVQQKQDVQMTFMQRPENYCCWRFSVHERFSYWEDVVDGNCHRSEGPFVLPHHLIGRESISRSSRWLLHVSGNRPRIGKRHGDPESSVISHPTGSSGGFTWRSVILCICKLRRPTDSSWNRSTPQVSSYPKPAWLSSLRLTTACLQIRRGGM